jgi:hypothetical protein
MSHFDFPLHFLSYAPGSSDYLVYELLSVIAMFANQQHIVRQLMLFQSVKTSFVLFVRKNHYKVSDIKIKLLALNDIDIHLIRPTC